MNYALKVNEKKSAKAFGRGLPISAKNAKAVCDEITGKSLQKSKELLLGVLGEKRKIQGRYFTNTTFEIANLLNSAEANAEFKGLNADRLIVHASVHESFTYHRPRRFKIHGTKRKMCNVQMILQEK
jgi:large subunit ribosomal protein L22